MERDWQTGANTFGFPKFTVNIGAVYNHGKHIPLPEAYLSQVVDILNQASDVRHD